MMESSHSTDSNMNEDILNSFLEMFETVAKQLFPSPDDISSGSLGSALKKFISSTVRNTLKSSLPSMLLDLNQCHSSACSARHNRMEQYSRLNCLLLHGNLYISHKLRGTCFSQKVVNFLNKCMSRSLGRELTVDDIDTSHPLQAKNGSKNPITIIKFVRRDLRNEILQRRKLMRRYHVNATEHLTDDNIKLYKKAQDFAGSNNVWTDQAVIYIRSGDNVFKISSTDDFPLFSCMELDMFNGEPGSVTTTTVQHPIPRTHHEAASSGTQAHHDRASFNNNVNKRYHSYSISNSYNRPVNSKSKHKNSSAQTYLHEQRNSVSYVNHKNTLNKNVLNPYNPVLFPAIEQVTENFINRKKSSAACSHIVDGTQYNSSSYKHNDSRYNKYMYRDNASYYRWGGGFAGGFY